MFDVFGPLKGLLKIDSVSIDNNVFRMHYKATVAVLVMFSLVVTASQYVGDPIDCIVDDVPLDVMDSYCWIYSTFTVTNRLSGRAGKDVVQPGVASYVENEDEVIHHKYYQWVCFALFFQAACFYAPRLLWKTWEGGHIRSLVMDLDCPLVGDQCKADRIRMLVEYFRSNLGEHDMYALRFFVCELFNLANVIGQMLFLDYFLDGEFTTYGPDVLRFMQMEPEDRADPMARVFPKVTKCTFHKYGPSGNIQRLDGLCVLPLNVVNEKIYVFLWFWFMVVALTSAGQLVYRMAVVLLPQFRVFLLRAKARMSPMADVETVSRKCRIGDWFLLYQLGKNLEQTIFKKLLSELAENMDVKSA